jgi:dienelactone hydrolase
MHDRLEFLEEAVVLARSGVVSLLIDLPFVRPGFVERDVQKEPLEWMIQQNEISRQTIVDLRRGLELLLNHRHVEPQRVAYVGHSFSADAGAILAGVEKRIHYFVLMAGNYSEEEFVRASSSPVIVAWRNQVGQTKLDQYFREYAWGDPVHFVGHTDADSIFLQFATGDDVSPAEAQKELSRFSAKNKQSKIYDAGHALNNAARLDRDRWLQHVLKLKTVDEKALGEIPQLK